jgi:hypothetical protein
MKVIPYKCKKMGSFCFEIFLLPFKQPMIRIQVIWNVMLCQEE